MDGAAAGEDEMGAATSSIEPKVTAEPGKKRGRNKSSESGRGSGRQTARTLLCGTGVVSGYSDTIFYSDTRESTWASGMCLMDGGCWSG